MTPYEKLVNAVAYAVGELEAEHYPDPGRRRAARGVGGHTMTTTTYPAGTRLHCQRCGATTVVMVDGTRGAWCTGRRVEHARVEMVADDTPGSEPEVAPSSQWR